MPSMRILPTTMEDAAAYLEKHYELLGLAYTGYDRAMQRHAGYVLARNVLTEEWVTWSMSDWRSHDNAADREAGICYAHGHYFTDWEEETADFSERFFDSLQGEWSLSPHFTMTKKAVV